MIVFLDKKNISAQALKKAEEIEKLLGVGRVVCFPDIHLKKKYLDLGYRIDIPSSTAISTKDCLYPQFRSRGINCGMALIKTNLFYDDSLLPKLERLLLDFNKGFFRNALNYFRFPLTDKFSLSAEEFRNVCMFGGNAVAQKFNFSRSADFGQNFQFSKKEADGFNYDGINKKWQKGTLRLKKKMGKYFGGNHFLEIQVVDEAFDPDLAEKWGLKKGQICILYHTAGDALDSILDEEILNRVIYQPKFIKVEKSSPDYRRIINAIRILMNYGFAYRFTTFIILRDLFDKFFGPEIELDYFLDKYHNTIEMIKGDSEVDNFVYRHNVTEIIKDSPAILSGSFNLRSYLNVGGPSASEYICSGDHGYGNLIEKFPSRRDEYKVKRIIFKKGVNLPLFVKRWEEDLMVNPGGDYILSLFEKSGLSNRVLSLRPIINLKFK